MSICLFSHGNVYFTLPDLRNEGVSGLTKLNGEINAFNTEHSELAMLSHLADQGWEDQDGIYDKLDPLVQELLWRIVEEYGNDELDIDHGISASVDERIYDVWESVHGNCIERNLNIIQLNVEEWLFTPEGDVVKPFEGTLAYPFVKGSKLLSKKHLNPALPSDMQWESLNLAQRSWLMPHFFLYENDDNEFNFKASTLMPGDVVINEVLPALAKLDDNTFSAYLANNIDLEHKIIPLSYLNNALQGNLAHTGNLTFESSIPIILEKDGDQTIIDIPKIENSDEIGLNFSLQNVDGNNIVGYAVLVISEDGVNTRPEFIMFEGALDILKDIYKTDDIGDVINNDFELLIHARNPDAAKLFYPFK